MSELEDVLGKVLSDPGMMEKIQSLAQSLGGVPSPEPEPESPSGPGLPDPAMLRKLAGLASATGVDQNQKALLRALGPYVSTDRANKLERAMRAAKMASVASSFLNGRGSYV